MKTIPTMMHALLAFCRRYEIEPPAAVELRFDNELMAHRFEAAMLLDYDRSGATMIIDLDRRRVSEVCGMPLHVTYQKFGPPYSVTMLPAYHPAVIDQRVDLPSPGNFIPPTRDMSDAGPPPNPRKK